MSADCGFSENERVLCYEPDMTKARVIYDAKILKIIEGEVPAEGNKRKSSTVMKQFLVHFQGQLTFHVHKYTKRQRWSSTTQLLTAPYLRG